MEGSYNTGDFELQCSFTTASSHSSAFSLNRSSKEDGARRLGSYFCSFFGPLRLVAMERNSGEDTGHVLRCVVV